MGIARVVRYRGGLRGMAGGEIEPEPWSVTGARQGVVPGMNPTCDGSYPQPLQPQHSQHQTTSSWRLEKHTLLTVTVFTVFAWF